MFSGFVPYFFLETTWVNVNNDEELQATRRKWIFILLCLSEEVVFYLPLELRSRRFARAHFGLARRTRGGDRAKAGHHLIATSLRNKLTSCSFCSLFRRWWHPVRDTYLYNAWFFSSCLSVLYSSVWAKSGRNAMLPDLLVEILCTFYFCLNNTGDVCVQVCAEYVGLNIFFHPARSLCFCWFSWLWLLQFLRKLLVTALKNQTGRSRTLLTIHCHYKSTKYPSPLTEMVELFFRTISSWAILMESFPTTILMVSCSLLRFGLSWLSPKSFTSLWLGIRMKVFLLEPMAHNKEYIQGGVDLCHRDRKFVAWVFQGRGQAELGSLIKMDSCFPSLLRCFTLCNVRLDCLVVDSATAWSLHPPGISFTTLADSLKSN